MNKLFIGSLAASLVLLQGVGLAQAKETSHKGKVTITDQDHNGLPDDWQKKYHLGNGKAIASKDQDKDGLTNLQEYQLNLNPTLKDTDKDKLPDGQEDNDHDGLTNLQDIQAGMSPASADTNHNGVKDGNEDTDSDGLTTQEEYTVKTNPTVADTNKNGVKDGQEDADHDKLVNEAEFQLGDNPLVADSNHNGVLDGNEDTDKDGLANSNEVEELHIKAVDTAGHKFQLEYELSRQGTNVHIKDQIGITDANTLVSRLNLTPDMTKQDVLTKVQQTLGVINLKELKVEVDFANGRQAELEDNHVGDDQGTSSDEHDRGDNREED